MKDQYIADIGDYGKFALLKSFADNGIRIGINWYHTENDGGSDGKFIQYLDNKDNLRQLCPEVFDTLKAISMRNRTIRGFERTNLLQSAVYYNRIMDFSGSVSEKNRQRRTWMDSACDKLSTTELIFLDPDNGLLMRKSRTSHGKEKYVLPEEVEQFYEHHNVVYYCHKGRRKPEEWEKYKAAMLYRLPGAIPFVLTYHKGTQRSYVFLIHPKCEDRYSKIICNFVDKWDGIFTKETANVQNRVEIRTFASNWIERFEKERDLYQIFDRMDFSKQVSDVGFIMDAGASFAETFPAEELGNLDSMKRIKADNKIIAPQLLGAAIHSQWRYVNHWSMSPPDEDDRAWFLFALKWLYEITGER